MQIKSYEEALKYLEGFIGKVVFKVPAKQDLKSYDPLERMRIVLSLLGNPQDKFKSVLVGGTSGKGSTAYLISHILTTAGYKTGLTLSPHLQKVNERLQINNQPISDEKFVKLLKSSILPSIRQMFKMEIGEPSYFEILIGMAFKYFEEEKVDIAIVEVGMGGEFDATNTLNPLIAVLTNVGLDHTNVLGNTVEKIAKTKAGIIKNEDLRFKLKEYNHQSLIINRKPSVVVAGVTQQSVIKIVEDRCRVVGAKLNLLWRDFGYKIKKETTYGINFDFISHEETLEDLRLSLVGQYQAENASLSIRAVLELRKLGFTISDNAIRKALSTAFFAGRFEIIPVVGSQSSVVSNKSVGRQSIGPKTDELKTGKPKSENRKPKTDNRIILDGAHNPTKMKEFLKNLKKLFPKERKIFIVGFKFDKDIKKMLKQIIKVADEIIVTEFKAKTDVAVHASAKTLNLKSLISRLQLPDATASGGQVDSSLRDAPDGASLRSE